MIILNKLKKKKGNEKVWGLAPKASPLLAPVLQQYVDLFTLLLILIVIILRYTHAYNVIILRRYLNLFIIGQ